MAHHRFLIGSLALGLAAWAVVLCMQIRPSTVLTRSQLPVAMRTAATMDRSPATLYSTACANCHQREGQGRYPVFPPLAGSPWVNGESDRLIAITLHGLSGPIEVNDVQYAGLMPGFTHLSDREIADVLSHVRRSWGNDAPPIAEADVAAVRARASDQGGR
jgi:mono/diheme cytochrome c family protein